LLIASQHCFGQSAPFFFLGLLLNPTHKEDTAIRKFLPFLHNSAEAFLLPFIVQGVFSKFGDCSLALSFLSVYPGPGFFSRNFFIRSEVNLSFPFFSLLVFFFEIYGARFFVSIDSKLSSPLCP